MSRERLYLFDTTLRDGAQTSGVDFTLDDMAAMKPVAAWGSEARVPRIDEVIAFPVGPTGGGDATDDYRDADRIHPRTHPDHDTAVWPPDRP